MPAPASGDRSADAAPMETRRRSPTPRYSNGLLMVLILAFTAGGFYELIGASTGKTNVAQAFATTGPSSGAKADNGVAATAQTTTTYVPGGAAAPTVDRFNACFRVDQGPNAHGMLTLLRYNGIPVILSSTVAPATTTSTSEAAPLSHLLAPPPAVGGAASGPFSSCSGASFVDSRSPGFNQILIFPSAALAAQAVADHDDAPLVGLSEGPVFIALTPALRGDAPGYQAALTKLIPRAYRTLSLPPP
jgi:hypothetical protein